MDSQQQVDSGQAGRQRRLAWRPVSNPQRRLLACPTYEVFFGGARGGGKTDGVIGEWAQHARNYGEHAIGLMVRRTSTQLAETIERAKSILGPIGAKFTSKPDRCRMPGGGRLNFAYLERDADAENYQGHSYTRVYIEEAGNFPSPAPIMKLHATLRSGAGVPVGMRLTGNPGGPGHHWLKARFIDPAPLGMVPIRDPESGLNRVYIPSRVTDNVALDREAYIRQLKQTGSPELVRAWLEGDWSVIAGAFFPEFSMERHVCKPVELPEHWLRYPAMDWGSARPFCVLWVAVSDGELPQFARGALVVYREWYGTNGQPNVGLRMPAEDVGAEIVKREMNDGKVGVGVLDPAAWASDGGPSIAERIARSGAIFRKADNARVGRLGAMGGWDQVRARLIGDDKPGLVIFNTCTHLIRTLPALQHDPDRPEDVDTEAEDHAPDTLRYACMARPYVVERKINPRNPRLLVGAQNEVTMDDLWALNDEENQRPRI